MRLLSRLLPLAVALLGGLVARPAPALAQVRPLPGTLPGTPPRPDSVRADTVRSDAARRDTTRRDTTSRAPRDSLGARVDSAHAAALRAAADTVWDPLRDLNVQFDGRMESKMERVVDKRCAGSAFSFALAAACRPGFPGPDLQFQFNLRADGNVLDRLHLTVDFDTQREFDASNVLRLAYEGKPGARLGRAEVGNVSFAPPPSRFITGGIPSNNYGVHAFGQAGPVRWRAIAAQQRGNVVNDRVFTVGAGGGAAVQAQERPVEDFEVEARRFFLTVDPRILPGWPNVDILDRAQLARIAAALPDTLRPTRVVVYRQLIGAQAQNPRGPRLGVRGSRNERRQTYEVLRENVDYYIDPSQLWIALVRPLSLNTERLAVAYEVTVGGRRTRHLATGGTPDVEFAADSQIANLLWEPELTPGDAAFYRELRNVYRVGGEDVRRETVALRVVTGTAGDQEAPVDPSGGATYLQLFGLAQPASPTTFDVENRLWPRPQDPNASAAQVGTKLIRDYFVVFPSAQPFARAGLVRSPVNPANDTLYTYPSEFLYSAQRPQRVYRMRVRYESEGTGAAATILLGAVQLRPGSERLSANGRPLVRDVDYTVDYEQGMVTFLRGESLFPTTTDVSVRYEENPIFVAQPTWVFGAAGELPTRAGSLFFTALSQQQSTRFTRPQLGFESSGSLVAGLGADLAWNAPLLDRLAGRLTALSRAARAPGDSAARSRVTLRGELAASKPRATNGMQAYVESFEGEGGQSLPLNEAGWYFSSLPRPTAALSARGLTGVLVPQRAATLAWQASVTAVGSRTPRTFSIDSIDPAVRLSAGGVVGREPVLWLSLFPLSVGGLPAADTALAADPWRWTIPNAPRERRWRSIRALLNPSGTGVDVTRTEMLEFYALVRTDDARVRNPTLVLDFGSPSEDVVALSPDTLLVAGADSTYRGRRLAAPGRVDTERDTLTRAFNASVNDRGLPGDRAPTLTVVEGGAARVERDVAICRAQLGAVRPLGDPRANCTVQNSRLDEEDIDQDGTLSIDATNESIRRYVVDLSDPRTWTRQTGGCTAFPAGLGDGLGAGATVGQRCWVQVRIPFRAPTDSTPGFNERRVRALRMTVVSAEREDPSAFTRLAIARLRLTGAPWLKRSGRALTGAGGDSTGTVGTYVIASTIGTQDSATLGYTPPPGVTDQTEQRRTGFETQQEQINERSMRIQAGAAGGTIGVFERAEAFFRFPEGVKNVMTYRQLRLWLRGASSGWGAGGELNAYVKLGRDENNFYMYRTEVNAGGSAEAWLPEVRVNLDRFYRLRVALQEAFLTGRLPGDGRYECRGADAELVRRSGLPRGQSARRWAACEDGYMIYTVDPNVSPPNLAQLQEVAVGLVRVDSAARGGDPILPNDTLELWVDDVRLAEAEDAPGLAGQLSVSAQIGDLAELRVGLTRRDPHFRQLAEAPTFVTSSDVSIGATVRLDRLLPNRLGIAMPLTIVHTGAGATPLFVAGSDLRGATVGGLRTPRDATTSYALTLRRASPLAGSPLALLLNNLSLTSTYVAGQARTTFQGSSRHAFSLRADYDLVSAAQSLVAPGTPTLPGGPPSPEVAGPPVASGLRWSPTALRLTSQLARSGNRQQSFLKPLAAPDDSGQVVRGLENVWRHAAVVEFRPVPALTARWDASTLRDLRDYDDLPLRGGPGADSLGIVRGAAVRRERSRLGPLDFGFERQRALNGTLELTPTLPRVSGWLRPRAQATSEYTMTRDPNARSLLGPGDLFADTLDLADTSAFARLPRRLGSTQLLSAGVTVDVGRALLERAGVATGPGADTTTRRGLRRLARLLQPIDLNVSRTLTSAFDATVADPALGLQLGLGGIGAFRNVDGRAATAAGLVNRVTVTNTLVLPFGVSLVSRLEGGDTRTWWRRSLTNAQAEGTGTQRTLPDLTLRWSWRPTWAAPVFSDLSASAGLLRQRQTSRAPGDSLSPADARATEAERYPVSARVTWPWLGGLVTAGGASLVRRTDDLPGARSASTTRERNGELRRAFRPPSRWGLKSDIATSAGFQLTRTRALLTARDLAGALAPELGGGRIVQADVGRQAFNLNANSDVAESLTLSLNGSRVVTFNNNINQRLVQTVFSAALQLSFFPGTFR